MKIGFSKSLWGMTEGQTLDDKFRLCKEAGYDGIEYDLIEKDVELIPDLCAKYDMYYIAMAFPMEPKDLVRDLKLARKAGAIKVNAHSGRDKWDFQTSRKYYAELLRIEADHGIPVAHETHRHRCFFTPWTTSALLKEFEDLKICADFSHWCCVTESLLDDFKEDVDLAISRAIHIHARVGHQEGPQVTDPAAPEWAEELENHCGWWDRIKEARKADGTELLTITPEFGPPKYMTVLPYTRQPISDLFTICKWTKDHLKKRWGA